MGYSYLDGSMTGALLSGQPVAPTSSPGNYIPGQGTAPYASPVNTGLSSVATGVVAGATPGTIPYDPGSGLSPAAYQNWAQQMIANGQGALIGNSGITAGASPQGPGVSTYPGYTSGGTSGAAGGTSGYGSDGLTVVGQQTPEEIARNASIMNSPVGGGITQGGGGGSAIGMAPAGSSTSSATGGLFSPTSSGPSSPPNFNNITTPGSPTIGYAAPTSPQGGTYLPQGGPLAMQQASPQSAQNSYLNTPANQLLGDPSYARFQHSPGYQYAVDEALGQVQRNASSRGLLESGRAMRDMTDRAQGMAQQDYGNWWNRQSQLFGDYQNRLQGLAGGNVGAQEANALGQNIGGVNLQTGSNLASLFGNQGTAGFGGVMNTGAAQANSMQQAGATQAQINAANQSTQLAGATLQNRQF